MQHGVPVVAAFGISCSTNSPSKLVYRVLAFCELSPLLCSTAPVDCRVNNKVPSVATASPVLARSAWRQSHIAIRWINMRKSDGLTGKDRLQCKDRSQFDHRRNSIVHVLFM